MILIDSNNLAYIAFFSLGDLSEGEERTGTIFGFLNIVNRIAAKFGGDMVFCFDSKKNFRKNKNREYKANRHKDLTHEKKIELNQMHRQITALRKEVLPQMGFNNIRISPGYEADDIIAQYALKYKKAVIVSTDKDLFQLLTKDVSIYDPRAKKVFTKRDFIKRYGITPKQWPRVKAIAGDPSDNIKGIKGVGEKTAIKFIKGKLKEESVAHKNITTNLELVLENKKLVRLPYLGKQLKHPYIENELTKERFIKTFDSLRFLYYLKDAQFKKWEENFELC